MTSGVEEARDRSQPGVVSSMPWRATVVTTPEQLKSYARQWNELVSSSEANTIFLTWEWISAWCQTVYPDVELAVVIVQDCNGRVMGIAPFYLSDLRVLGLVKYRCLRVLGDCHCGGEYSDIIVRRGFEDRAMGCVMHEFLERETVWDCIWIRNVAGWTGASDRLRDASRRFHFHIHQRSLGFSSFKLPDTYDAYLKGLSRNRREQFKRKSRRFKEAHDVEFVCCQTKDELPEFLSNLFTLHRKRWESVGQAGSFARRPSMKLFYEAFAPVALDRGWLRLYALKVDGAIRAIQYGYAYDGVFSQMQEGFEVEGFDGIGNVLRTAVIEACIEEGLQEYDFLGGHGEHKSRFGAELRTGYDMFIGRKSLKNKALFSKEIWPTGRYISEGRPANEGHSHDG